MHRYLSLIKFSHTVFALPFALVGYFLAVHSPHGSFDWKLLLLILCCMVFARSAAMAFNRYADRELDAANERTRQREIPSGKITPRSALLFTLLNALLFVLCTYFIKPICFLLSPIALAVILGYSYTKRFTALSHFVLGLGLALAPVGAYLAVTGTFDIIPIIVGSMVLLWVSGFDIIYALQDEDFDIEHQLHSIPSFLGGRKAMLVSIALHTVCALLCLILVWMLNRWNPQFSWILWVGSIVFIGSLFYQHTIVKTADLSRVNLAFFTMNGIASLVFGSTLILDFYV